ncbi:hypothetical protein [Pyxidicoccus sp. MSG2]|uniref:hypothetical protein n=1 Tax=Pyxidicoccus sp. MSG2 TaxID=2996790 RepID=UPI0022720C3C|nr:hypothetical protein [Pyxidicoccus sp. MSG2]MCY1021033.1 hypothetical protein [Pyxidicoccus sp. MSG2]
MRHASRVWVLGSVLGLMSGCAALSNTAASKQAEAPKPTCPDSIPDELNLELGFRPELAARTWVPAHTFEHLGFHPGDAVKPAFQQELALATGPVQVFGLMEHSTKGPEGGGSLVVARPHAGGFCVVNTWSTWQSSPVGLSLANTWTSPDGKLAILLVRMEMAVTPDGPQTRWVTLGTDGNRMWIALGSPPEHQLIVPSVALFPKGKDLYLDIQQRRVTRLLLGKDGRFVIPPNR